MIEEYVGEEITVPDLQSSTTQVTLLLAGALAVRLLVFDHVPVNYDTGFYLSDALRAVGGDVPLVDYRSRSPLYHYLLGGFVTLGGSPLTYGRTFMILTTTGLGLAVFALVKRIHTHRAALFAATIFLFTPFTIIWGTWVKTSPFAELIAVVGLIILLPHLDDPSTRPRYTTAFGALLGAAFLIRRVVIVHAAVVTLFLAAYRIRHHDERVAALVTAGTVPATFACTVVAGYSVMAGGDLATTIQLINYHALLMFPVDVSIPTSGGDAVVAASAVAQLLVFCGDCSDRTLLITLQIVAVSLPALLLAWAYFEPIVRTNQGAAELERLQALVPLVGLTLLALVVLAYGQLLVVLVVVAFSLSVSVTTDLNSRSEGLAAGTLLLLWAGLFLLQPEVPSVPNPFLLVGISLGAAVGMVYVTKLLPNPPKDDYRSPQITLVVLLIGGIWLAYLVRDAKIFVIYFQDVFPYVAVVAGIGAKRLYENAEGVTVSRRTILALLVLGAIPSLIMAPYINAHHGAVERPYDPFSEGTVSNVQSIGADINERTPPDATVFTAQPLYALESDAENYDSFSREYWLFIKIPYSAATNETVAELREAMRTGEIQYVVMESRTKGMMRQRPELQSTFRNNYCRIKTSERAYEVVGATLYVHSEQAPTC